MRATLNLPPSVRLIEAALEGLVSVNRVLIESGKVPPSPLDSRVRYKRESSGLEEWDNAYTCMKRGWGDCEDLNGWECARINIEEDSEAICALIRTGQKLFHCVVQMSDGSYRDVCPDLGMKAPGTSLEGLPWLEVAAGYVPKRSPRTDTRTAKQKRYDRVVKRGDVPLFDRPVSYVPKASERPTSKPYEPKSSRPESRREPSTQTQERDDETEAMVSPTSTSSQQGTQAVPMESYSEDVYEEAMELAEPEPIEDEDEDQDELLEAMGLS